MLMNQSPAPSVNVINMAFVVVIVLSILLIVVFS